jgi:5-dehydro-2-deoxygluconokinase
VAIVKQGADGTLVATGAGMATVPSPAVDVLCGLGAGDAFGGALCHALLSGLGPVAAVEFASAAGAIVASRLLCSDAMPTAGEVHALLTAQRETPAAQR